ncbi:uncharacterized protein LOC133018544 [Limanda limanda]|uniref:uncharacterized protein LOC133018544 n=1 Tax=Limanda limanda TaxID=27771 RepID=UPI0029C80DA6|nr:uncharacterized protein LOC133018544 [Limanda limanda]
MASSVFDEPEDPYLNRRNNPPGGMPNGVLCGEPSAPLKRGGNNGTNSSADAPPTTEAEMSVRDHATLPPTHNKSESNQAGTRIPDTAAQFGQYASGTAAEVILSVEERILELNMALIVILFFISTATSVGASSFFATLDCNAESYGKHGQQSLLQCVVKPIEEAADMEIEMVYWKKEGVEKPLLIFYEGKTTLQTDYMFAEPSWNSKNMNVSLLITNTMVEHAGVYICRVGTNYGDFEVTINLRVTAKYSEPTVSSVLGKITQNTNGHQKVFGTVDCNAESFGKHGQQSLLQCVVKPIEEAVDMEIEMVFWKKEGVEKPLLIFYGGKTTLQTDYMFAEPSWNSKNMNVSLLITNTMVAHAGVYVCTVVTNNGDYKMTTNLTVTAKYSEPTVSSVLGKITQNTDGHQKDGPLTNNASEEAEEEKVLRNKDDDGSPV